MEIKVTVSATCPSCGNDDIPILDDLLDSARVTCPKCGSDLGSYGDLNEEIGRAVEDRIDEALSPKK